MNKIRYESKLPEKQKEFEDFKKFRDSAIDHEQGENFHRNILEKGVQVFFSGYSFCIFKIMKIEDVNTCYIYYMYRHVDKDKKDNSFKSCYYALINYCLGNNVKFIYYSEKEKDKFYRDFMENNGYNIEVTQKKYPKDFICRKCGNHADSCTCKTINYSI